MSTEWQFLVTLNDHLRPSRDPVEFQAIAVRLLGQYLRANRVTYAFIQGDEYVVSQSFVDGVPPPATRGPVASCGKSTVAAYRRGDTVVVDDVSRDTRLTDGERDQLLAGHIGAFVGAPLFKHGRWLATFVVHSAAPRSWSPDQIALVEVTAQRTWAAGERARAEEAVGRSEDRQAFINRLNDAIRPLADPARILNESCRLLGMHLHVDRVVYGDIDGDDFIVRGEYLDALPPSPSRVPWRSVGDSRTAAILRNGILVVDDTSAEPHTPAERAALQAAGIGGYISPFLIKDGRFIGSFGIHSRLPRAWTRDEIALVQEVADRIWATLEHRKAEAELRANEERLAFLLRLNDALRHLTDPIDVQQAAARLLGDHLRVARVGYVEIEGREYVVRCEYTRGVPPLAAREVSATFRTALRDAYRRGETIVVNDIGSDPRFADPERDALATEQIAALVGETLIKGGLIVAVFGVIDAAPRVWTPTEISLVRDVAERTWEAVERARAEAALREREHRVRLALDASGGASWTWDLRSNRVEWDDVFRARFGFTRHETPSYQAWLDRVHSEDRAGTETRLQEILQGKDTWDHTYRVTHPDGKVLWIQSLGRAVRDANGHLTRLTGLELDITGRRRTEEALQARREEEHNRELRLLLETASQGIVSVDEQGLIKSANHAFGVMFGWSRKKLIGQPVKKLIPGIWLAAHERHGGQDLVGERRDGSTFPIEVTVNYVPTADGPRAFAFVTDITERQRAAWALRERTAELEYRTTQLSQMAWDLTLAEHHARENIARTLHDGLQQLLVIVALNLDQQVKREREAGVMPSELVADARHHIQEAIDAARSLNYELFPPVLQRSGLPAALTWLANWTRDKYKLEVQTSVDPRADSPRKDVRTLLFESVRELLFNAVKYAHADRVRLTLTLDADDHLCITVADQGIGFEPARLDDRSKAGQVGWGLFSIRERLTLLGGRFGIESAPGRGTCVTLVAPRGAAHTNVPVRRELRAASVRPALAGAANGAPASALRVLIVDDHPAVRSTLRKMLDERPQISVIGDASDGLEAIARTQLLHPDVILMDVAMPQMDGIEATARIRAEFPDIEILGLSTQARSETVQAIERAGASHFFVKGTDTQQLIDHLLALYASRRHEPTREGL